MADRYPCPVCDGAKWAPCRCSDYCTSPEGMAIPRHDEIECVRCDEGGEVCGCCGLPYCGCDEQEVAA